jgi:hypothetical protein
MFTKDADSEMGQQADNGGLGSLLEAAGLGEAPGSAALAGRTAPFLRELGKSPKPPVGSTVFITRDKMAAPTEWESEPAFKKPRQRKLTEISPAVDPADSGIAKRSAKHTLAAATEEMQDGQGQAVWQQIRMILEDQQRQLHQQMAAARSSDSSTTSTSTLTSVQTPLVTPSARKLPLLQPPPLDYLSDSHSAPESGDDANATPTSLALRRRQAKREYSRAYRVQQKNQAVVLEVQLSQANMALQFLQNMHVQLQVKYNDLVAIQTQRAAGSSGAHLQEQELNSSAEQLRMENECLRRKLQEQTDIAASRESLVRKLLDLGPTIEAQTLEEAVAACDATALTRIRHWQQPRFRV